METNPKEDAARKIWIGSKCQQGKHAECKVRVDLGFSACKCVCHGSAATDEGRVL